MPASQLVLKQLTGAAIRALPHCTATLAADNGDGRIILAAIGPTGRHITHLYPTPTDQQAIGQTVRKFVKKVADTHAAEQIPFAYALRQNKHSLWVRVVGSRNAGQHLDLSHALVSKHYGSWRRAAGATSYDKADQTTFKYVR
jgi:hypothetical protein